MTETAADDIAAAAWTLVAIQQRIGERNLDGWPSLKIIADQAASLIRPDRKEMHRRWAAAALRRP